MIKLFVVHHKDVYIPKSPLLVPIRSDEFKGDNIAGRLDYSELRAHYHVWKNEPADTDYIGFFHYRRYLDLNQYPIIPACKTTQTPYTIQKLPNVDSWNYEKIKRTINEFDVIVPVAEYTGIPVYKRYAQSNGQRVSDLDLIRMILFERYPEFLNVTDKYLYGQREYYGNIFIMHRELFNRYCAWLFDILNEFDFRVQVSPPRTDGFLGERLFGIYFTWLKKQDNIRYGELPRVHYSGYDDENHNFVRERLINLLLPPGSIIRAVVRKILYH